MLSKTMCTGMASCFDCVKKGCAWLESVNDNRCVTPLLVDGKATKRVGPFSWELCSTSSTTPTYLANLIREQEEIGNTVGWLTLLLTIICVIGFGFLIFFCWRWWSSRQQQQCQTHSPQNNAMQLNEFLNSQRQQSLQQSTQHPLRESFTQQSLPPPLSPQLSQFSRGVSLPPVFPAAHSRNSFLGENSVPPNLSSSISNLLLNPPQNRSSLLPIYEDQAVIIRPNSSEPSSSRTPNQSDHASSSPEASPNSSSSDNQLSTSQQIETTRNRFTFGSFDLDDSSKSKATVELTSFKSTKYVKDNDCVISIL